MRYFPEGIAPCHAVATSSENHRNHKRTLIKLLNKHDKRWINDKTTHTVIKCNAYETCQTSLLYIFVHCFGLDSGQRSLFLHKLGFLCSFRGDILHNPRINCLKSWVRLWLFERKSGANEQLIKMRGDYVLICKGVKSGPKLNGSVRSKRKSCEKTGPPFEVDPFSRSDRLEFWLNGSREWIPTGPTGKSGPPQKVDQFFQNFSSWTKPIHWVLDRNFRKFWLNGSRPKFITERNQFALHWKLVEDNK